MDFSDWPQVGKSEAPFLFVLLRAIPSMSLVLCWPGLDPLHDSTSEMLRGFTYFLGASVQAVTKITRDSLFPILFLPISVLLSLVSCRKVSDCNGDIEPAIRPGICRDFL
jgi:hypothetical protein